MSELEKKYLGEDGAKQLVKKVKDSYSPIGHTHTAEEVGADKSGSSAAALTLAKQYTNTKSNETINYINDQMNSLGGTVEITSGTPEKSETVLTVNPDSNDEISLYTSEEIDVMFENLANNDHNHDDVYYTESEIDSKLDDVNSEIEILSGQVAFINILDNEDVVDTGSNPINIAIDSALSTSSTNPVQNKVITNALNNKADKSSIPTSTNQLTNDSGFITSIPSEYITDSELNAKGYLTEHQDISGKADKATTLSGYGITDGATKDELNAFGGSVEITSGNPEKSNTVLTVNPETANRISVYSVAEVDYIVETEVADKIDSMKVDIVQQILAQMGGTGNSIFGKISEDGTITITTDLANGDYVLMYENEDGSLTELGTINISTNTDGDEVQSGIVSIVWLVETKLDKETGAQTSNYSGYGASESIEIVDGYTYTATATKKSSSTFHVGLGVCYYDSTGSYISYEELWAETTEEQSVKLTIPSNAASFKLRGYYGSYGAIMLDYIGLEWKFEGESSESEAIINLIPLSVASDDSEYIGANGEDGYSVGYRVNSSGQEVAQDGMCCTGFIPYNPGQIIRLKNVTVSGTKDAYLVEYYADKSYKQVTAIATQLVDDGNGVLTGTTATSSNIGFIRIACGVIDDTSILTLDQEIKYVNLARPTSNDWLTDYRYNSSGSLVTVSGGSAPLIMTNYISVDKVSDIYIKGIDLLSDYDSSGNNYGRVYLYDSNKNYLGFCYTAIPNNTQSVYEHLSASSEDKNITVFKWDEAKNSVNKLQTTNDIKFIRFGGLCDDVDIVLITVDKNENDTSIPITWNEGYKCSYTVGQSCALTADSNYCTSDEIYVEEGETYTLTVTTNIPDYGARVVGIDSSGLVTENLMDSLFDVGTSSFTFTPSSGTEKIRIRSYAGVSTKVVWTLSKN